MQDAAYEVAKCMEVSREFFFFQAEAGIRDADVTGVQTCALPIYLAWCLTRARRTTIAHGERRALIRFGRHRSRDRGEGDAGAGRAGTERHVRAGAHRRIH